MSSLHQKFLPESSNKIKRLKLLQISKVKPTKPIQKFSSQRKKKTHMRNLSLSLFYKKTKSTMSKNS